MLVVIFLVAGREGPGIAAQVADTPFFALGIDQRFLQTVRPGAGGVDQQLLQGRQVDVGNVAGRLLGNTPRQVVFRIILPQAREAILAGTLLVFLYGLSDFGAVSLMRFDTITRVIFSSQLADRAASLTLGLVLALVALLVASTDRVFATRRTPVAVIGAHRIRYRLGRGMVPAIVVAGSTFALAVALPVGVFITWILRGSTTVGVGYSGWGDSLGFLVEPTLGSPSLVQTAPRNSSEKRAGMSMSEMTSHTARGRASVSISTTTPCPSATLAVPSTLGRCRV